MNNNNNNLKSSELRPSVVAIPCVVCNKRGRVNWDKDECKACLGKGYLLVPPEKGDSR